MSSVARSINPHVSQPLDRVRTDGQTLPAALVEMTPRPQSVLPVMRRPSPLDDRRRAFLRMVSHELRTPLNSVIGFSEIIHRELYGPMGNSKYRDHAGVIRESGLKLLKLVNQVLEIARLDAGTADLVLQPESPKTAVAQVVNALELEAAARKVSMNINIDPATPLVLADPRGLTTILTNLLQNAIAFSPEGGEVEINVHPKGGAVYFRITDHGPGIASADISRLMMPFEQGENVLTRRGQGAGLGLPIVQLLCLDMGGKLRLRSSPGQGLTALVRLVAASASPDESSSPKS